MPERQITAVEQVQRHVERLLRVVVALEGVARGQILERLFEIDERLLELVAVAVLRHVLLAEPGDAQDVEDEDAVVRDDRAAALGDDGRVFHAGVVADRLDVVDDVVGVFLERVVHARLEVGLRAVVVHAKTATDVDVFEAGAFLRQLGVDPGGLVQRALDDADVGDLTAEVEVEELEAVLHANGLELFEALPDLGDGQAELRAVPAG